MPGYERLDVFAVCPNIAAILLGMILECVITEQEAGLQK